jgi:hypothetical protein
MIKKYAMLFFLTAVVISSTMSIRSAAQSRSTHPGTNTVGANVMAGYAAASQAALVSGTAATNLIDTEVHDLMNESIKTNLAAQLWFRARMMGEGSCTGARMAIEVRALESLRAGRTNDAIRDLEQALDGDIISLAAHLRASDETNVKLTRQPREALKWARDYRAKFPHHSGNASTDDGVKDAFSYLEGR